MGRDAQLSPGIALRRCGSLARGARVLKLLGVSPLRSTWLLARRRERFVLRVDTPVAADFGLDRRHEWRAGRLAAEAGLGPWPVLLVPGPPAVLVTRYLAGPGWQDADLVTAEGRARCASLLRRLHALPAPGGDTLGAAAMRYQALAGTTRALRLRAELGRLLARLPAAWQGTFCHRDPLACNIVGDRCPQLVDWEYAGPADPWFDVAAAGAGLTREASRALAVAYAGGEGRVDWQRWQVGRDCYRRVALLWSHALGAVQERRSVSQDIQGFGMHSRG
jgi:aminoglycoside phosphotransferase (APT) family kinase protein